MEKKRSRVWNRDKCSMDKTARHARNHVQINAPVSTSGSARVAARVQRARGRAPVARVPAKDAHVVLRRGDLEYLAAEHAFHQQIHRFIVHHDKDITWPPSIDPARTPRRIARTRAPAPGKAGCPELFRSRLARNRGIPADHRSFFLVPCRVHLNRAPRVARSSPG